MTLASQRWLHDRTSSYDAASRAQLLDALLAVERRPTVCVAIPARDEEPTVAGVVGPVQELLVTSGLVEEVVVVDGESGDATAARAADAGARVIRLADILDTSTHPGKGGAMWAALATTTADVVVFLDADVEPFDPGWVCALLQPLFRDPAVQLVKGAYDRPVRGGAPHAIGGRVTELVARPLLNLLWPELSGVLQPLAGECAARRSLLSTLAFSTGYGVEFGLLVDTWASAGLGALAQVDLGARHHRHHDDAVVARMAASVLHTALRRLEQQGRGRLAVPPQDVLHQVLRSSAGALTVQPFDVASSDLPPIAGRGTRAGTGRGA
ncbi:MAG: glucosyl-3-phosphoglycerate synthase [Solirubrobacteraceae bacterium]|nr:glucosyl-3-phosphoglycerate synthase [Solirubrobacteraceae bacterium]